jgi:hypothetical protein
MRSGVGDRAQERVEALGVDAVEEGHGLLVAEAGRGEGAGPFAPGCLRLAGRLVDGEGGAVAGDGERSVEANRTRCRR